MDQNKNIEIMLQKLSKSRFRSSFSLKEKDKAYIREKGRDVIASHGRDFIDKRLAPQFIPNDGRQTPTKGHPVFIAQHATATCCRKCLMKWHRIPMNKELNAQQKEYILALIMAWIDDQAQMP